MKKKLLTFMMAFCIAATSIPMEGVAYAAEVQHDGETESSESTETVLETESTEDMKSTETVPETESSESIENT